MVEVPHYFEEQVVGDAAEGADGDVVVGLLDQGIEARGQGMGCLLGVTVMGCLLGVTVMAALVVSSFSGGGLVSDWAHSRALGRNLPLDSFFSFFTAALNSSASELSLPASGGLLETSGEVDSFFTLSAAFLNGDASELPSPIPDGLLAVHDEFDFFLDSSSGSGNGHPYGLNFPILNGLLMMSGKVLRKRKR
ncbi:hypothetical protein IMZ48_27575 [Candidatus Bathyarchaeota archaeon]|nr:hypothetical protein [Candidatus Bathyarchaeota archaeon]